MPPNLHNQETVLTDLCYMIKKTVWVAANTNANRQRMRSRV